MDRLYTHTHYRHKPGKVWTLAVRAPGRHRATATTRPGARPPTPDAQLVTAAGRTYCVPNTCSNLEWFSRGPTGRLSPCPPQRWQNPGSGCPQLPSPPPGRRLVPLEGTVLFRSPGGILLLSPTRALRHVQVACPITAGRTCNLHQPQVTSLKHRDPLGSTRGFHGAY